MNEELWTVDGSICYVDTVKQNVVHYVLFWAACLWTRVTKPAFEPPADRGQAKSSLDWKHPTLNNAPDVTNHREETTITLTYSLQDHGPEKQLTPILEPPYPERGQTFTKNEQLNQQQPIDAKQYSSTGS